MKIIYIKRKTKIEKLYSRNLGECTIKITYIKKYFLGVPLKTIHKYRQMYYGKIKNQNDSVLICLMDSLLTLFISIIYYIL
jgi:hypothetical protein